MKNNNNNKKFKSDEFNYTPLTIYFIGQLSDKRTLQERAAVKIENLKPLKKKKVKENAAKKKKEDERSSAKECNVR